MSSERVTGSAAAFQFQLAIMRFFGEKVTADQADKYASRWMEKQKELFKRPGYYRQIVKIVVDMDRKRIPYPTPMSLLERHLRIRFK